MEAQVLTKEGKKGKAKLNLPQEIFDLPWNADLVRQVVLALQANRRTPVAHAKGRSEVRGGGIKPWRQKGTGRARHGSIRSPLWIGGGVTHGPNKEKDYSQKVNRKMGTKALFTILSQKLRDGEVLFIDDLSVAEPKTKEAEAVLLSLAKEESRSDLSKKNGNRALILIPEKNEATEKSFRNLKSARVEEIRNLNALDALSYKFVVFSNPEKAVESLASKLQTKAAK